MICSIDLIHLIDCVILPMSLQGLHDHRNRIMIIETELQTALCFAHGCSHILGFHFYFLQSSNAKALVDWIHLNWHPLFGKLLLHLQIDTLCGQHDYSWVPLVPETIGPIDQYDNVFSMANALVFGLFSKK